MNKMQNPVVRDKLNESTFTFQKHVPYREVKVIQKGGRDSQSPARVKINQYSIDQPAFKDKSKVNQKIQKVKLKLEHA